MAKYDEVGRGSYGVYKKRDPEWPYAVVAIIVVLGLIYLFA